MVSMYFFLIFFLLTAGFVALIWFERKRDKKIFQGRREAFDRYVREWQERVATLDLRELLEYSMRYLALRISHVVVAVLHFIARRTERVLRRARRRLDAAKPVEEPSSYVKAMKKMKEE